MPNNAFFQLHCWHLDKYADIATICGGEAPLSPNELSQLNRIYDTLTDGFFRAQNNGKESIEKWLQETYKIEAELPNTSHADRRVDRDKSSSG